MDPPRADPPPLSLDLASLTPVTLLPPLPKPDGERVPATPVAYPTLSPGFQLSPTSNYAAPYGQASLGETLRACVRLRNTSQGAVHGVKMMLEVQSPGGRVRLGEVVHGGARPEGMDPSVAETRAWDELPALAPGGAVDLGGAHELTELGLHILICSVAWETEHGRRTFQRFLKFTAALPLAIKTRVITPSAPNTALDAERRGDVYLEVLMQNTAPVAMRLASAELEPVAGMRARAVAAPDPDAGVDARALGSDDVLPGDTVQRLFVLSPEEEGPSTPRASQSGAPGPGDGSGAATSAAPRSDGNGDGDGEALPLSAFPPVYAAGTVLPLGRLRLSWVSGPHHEAGAFVTSMLNRRTTLPQPAPSRPASLLSLSGNPRLSLNRSINRPARDAWEWDLTVSGARRVAAEGELELTLRLGVRCAADPGDAEFGLQVLTPVAVGSGGGVGGARRASRASTPLGSVGSPGSRPLTPVSSQLRHAIGSPAGAASASASAPPPPPAKPGSPAPRPASVSVPGHAAGAAGPAFPPPPSISRAGGGAGGGDGRVLALGASLTTVRLRDWVRVRERAGTSYAAEAPAAPGAPGAGSSGTRFEAHWAGRVRWAALEPGVADLGAVRVLAMGDGAVGREWELGSAVVFD